MKRRTTPVFITLLLLLYLPVYASTPLDTVQTNMVFVTTDLEMQPQLTAFLRERGVLVGGYGQLRLVTHHDIDAEDVALVIEAFEEALRKILR